MSLNRLACCTCLAIACCFTSPGPGFAASLPSPTAQREPVAWKYVMEQPAGEWFQSGFNDSTWKTGSAGFGCPGTAGGIVRTEWTTPDIWVRRAFELPDGAPDAPMIRMHHDEDVEVYLNGRLAVKTAGFTTGYQDFPIQAEALATLKAGRNTMAIHCHQTTGGQYIDAGLIGSAVTVTVTDKTIAPKPVSPLLFSSFLELAFGRSDLIAAELLLDRGFEMPERATLNSGNGWCARSKPRLEQEDWWHSGYEEHPWRLVKGEGNKAATMNRLGDTWPHAPNGKLYLRVENKSASEPVFVAQDGIWVDSGTAYDFTGLLCDGTMFSATPVSAHPVALEVCLFPEGKLDAAPLSSAKLLVDATTCRKFSAALSAPSATGRATFALRVPPKSSLVCDMLSLRPANRVGEIRREVIAGMRQIPASVIRFPGGCFASTYHWRDGIGERDERPVDFAHWWNFPMLNDIGTVEFLAMCKAIGAEPMMCVPVMFDDAYNAADWVAFCNTANHPLHAKAGIERAPMRVKYWELDNETYRRMDAITYARRCVEFSRAMKKVDPQVKTIMDCYWVYHQALREMLEVAGGDIDLVNNRGGSIAELRGDLAVLAEYNAKHGRYIRLCHSEYRASNYDLPVDTSVARGADDGLNAPKSKDEKDTAIAKASRWSYGLSILCDFLEYQGFGGDFQFANFTGYNDGWGEGLINCAKSRVYPSAAGEAFNFLRGQGMAWPLTVDVLDVSPLLRTQAAWDEKKKSLVLFALNLSSQPRSITWDIASLKGPFKAPAKVEALWAPAARVSVTEIGPDPIARETVDLPTDGRTVVLKVRPYSATAVRLGVGDAP